MTDFLILVGSGFFIGIFAIVIGGAGFFSIPLLQWLFPEASFGVVIGNLKFGGFFRMIGSTISTHPHIEYRKNVKLALAAFLGTIVGATLISDLDQRWMFPALIVAVFLTLYAPRIAHLITNKIYNIAAFLIGVYTGVLGAGIGILLVALLRLRYSDDRDIAYVKIQARFVEWLLLLSAVVTHYLHGNLVTSIWLPWSIGGLAGGYAGGLLLNRIGKLPGNVQKIFLYIAFALALIVAALKFIE